MSGESNGQGSDYDSVPERIAGSEPDAAGQTSPGAPEEPQRSAAVQRFESCRWRQAAEEGVPAHCTHRDVSPIAGTHGFDPDAWCADCGFYKVRRTPRKRPAPPPPDRYYY